MPPVNQQRSTTGLIIALVAFVILFVTSSIFAMSYYNQLKLKTNELDENKKLYASIIPDAALNGQTISDLKAAKPDPRFAISSADSILDVAVKERDALGNLIVGTIGTNSPGQIADQATAAIKKAQTDADKDGIGVKLDPASPNLVAAIGILEKRAAELAVDAKKYQDQYTAEAAAHAADQANFTTAAASYEQNTKKQQEADAAALATAQKSGTDSQGIIDKTSADLASQSKQLNDLTTKATADEQNYQRQIAALKLQVTTLQQKLGNRRMDPQNIVTRVSGKIIRAAGKDVCYINLGRGKQISPGLTFEVYDRADGVPPIPPNTSADDHLPVGKASIEVTSVGEDSSECRVVHLEPGAVLTEGDVIANLVYDPNVKFKFFVYGNFDMGQSGRPSAADADVIRRLITQWGGELTNKIDVDTDFVVLGAEPQLPSYTKEELGEPQNQKRYDDAQADLEKYSALRESAIEYHIPVLNQNRFLYYVGFYDQAKR